MLSSSLFLRPSTTLVSILSLLAVPALGDFGYVNKKTTQGKDFVKDFNFFDRADPTHGYVTYSGKDASEGDGRITYNEGRFQMRVDSQTVLKDYLYNQYRDINNVGRKSVRIESANTYTKGLFVADVIHLPERQCGIWNAWWTVGAQNTWPDGGEIDIYEGVHENSKALAALHTGSESMMSTNQALFTGQAQGDNCNVHAWGNWTNSAGCGIEDRDTNSFNSPVGRGNGRVIAMEWTDSAIKIWNFARTSAPSDILGDHPNPSRWGTPVQQFTGNVNIPRNFNAHKMIFNTDFCGDWAGDAASWGGSGCQAKTGYQYCAEYVAKHPTAFQNVYWDINVVKVYQKETFTSTTSTTTTRTTTRSSTTSSTTTTTTTSSKTSSTISTRTPTSTTSSSTTSSTRTSTTSATSTPTTTTSTSTSSSTSSRSSTTVSTTPSSSSTTTRTSSSTASSTATPSSSTTSSTTSRSTTSSATTSPSSTTSSTSSRSTTSSSSTTSSTPTTTPSTTTSSTTSRSTSSFTTTTTTLRSTSSSTTTTTTSRSTSSSTTTTTTTTTIPTTTTISRSSTSSSTTTSTRTTSTTSSTTTSSSTSSVNPQSTNPPSSTVSSSTTSSMTTSSTTLSTTTSSTATPSSTVSSTTSSTSVSSSISTGTTSSATTSSATTSSATTSSATTSSATTSSATISSSTTTSSDTSSATSTSTDSSTTSASTDSSTTSTSTDTSTTSSSTITESTTSSGTSTDTITYGTASYLTTTSTSSSTDQPISTTTTSCLTSTSATSVWSDWNDVETSLSSSLTYTSTMYGTDATDPWYQPTAAPSQSKTYPVYVSSGPESTSVKSDEYSLSTSDSAIAPYPTSVKPPSDEATNVVEYQTSAKGPANAPTYVAEHPSASAAPSAQAPGSYTSVSPVSSIVSVTYAPSKTTGSQGPYPSVGASGNGTYAPNKVYAGTASTSKVFDGMSSVLLAMVGGLLFL